MTHRNDITIAALFALCLTGCAHPNPAQPPTSDARPNALKQLDRFAGIWQADGQLHNAKTGERIHLKGLNEVAWEQGFHILLARGRTSVGDGPPQLGIAAWTFDEKAKLLRGVMIDSSGAVGTGTADFDESTATLTGHLKTEGPSGILNMEGRVRFVDANTKQEHWIGRDEKGAQLFEIQKTELRKQ